MTDVSDTPPPPQDEPRANRRQWFNPLPAWIWGEYRAGTFKGKPHHRLTLEKIVHALDRDGRDLVGWVTYARLETDTGKGRRQLRRDVRELCEMGYLVEVYRGQNVGGKNLASTFGVPATDGGGSELAERVRSRSKGQAEAPAEDRADAHDRTVRTPTTAPSGHTRPHRPDVHVHLPSPAPSPTPSSSPNHDDDDVEKEEMKKAIREAGCFPHLIDRVTNEAIAAKATAEFVRKVFAEAKRKGQGFPFVKTAITDAEEIAFRDKASRRKNQEPAVITELRRREAEAQAQKQARQEERDTYRADAWSEMTEAERDQLREKVNGRTSSKFHLSGPALDKAAIAQIETPRPTTRSELGVEAHQ